MSAFVCRDKTINGIVFKLYSRINFDKDQELKKELVKCGYGVAKNIKIGKGKLQYTIKKYFLSDGWEHQLGQDLFDLNCEAVNARYGKNQAKEFRPLDYKYGIVDCTLPQALKNLHCLQYQCREGDVPSKKLYKLLEKINHCWCYKLATNNPDYQMARWDY